jgi:hypothetical protein
MKKQTGKKNKIKLYKPQLGIGNHVMPLIKTKPPDQVIKLAQKLHEFTFTEREREREREREMIGI